FGQPASLPRCIVGVLNRQQRERSFLRLTICVVECTQLAHDDLHRPTVADDVMHRYQEHVLFIGEPNQSSANERPVLEIKWSRELLTYSFGESTRRFFLGAPVLAHACKACFRRTDSLIHLTVSLVERRAQRFVP